MIIAYDVSHIQRHKAGIGRLAASQLKGLLATDTKNEYLLHGWSPDIDLELIDALAQTNVRLSVASYPGVIKRLYWNYLRFPPLETLIGTFDIFHCAEPVLPPLRKAKAIVSFNDSAYYKFPQFYSPVTARKWDYLYRRALRQANAITVLSENTRADLIEIVSVSPENIHVVRPPTDPLFFHHPSTEEIARVKRKFSLPDQFVLFVGTLEPRKNIPRLVQAFERFSQTLDISLVIVGRRGWLYEKILHVIASSPQTNKIILLDYVSDSDLNVLYHEAVMFVFPSLYEGHGYPVVEAMAAGTPVITSNNSSLREIGEGVAILVDAENVEEISSAMRRVYDDPVLRLEMGNKGKERAAQFTVERAANAILSIYDKLAG